MRLPLRNTTTLPLPMVCVYFDGLWFTSMSL